MRRLHKLSGRNVNNTDVEGGYSVLKGNYIELRRLLSAGANINLMGLERDKRLKPRLLLHYTVQAPS